MMTNVGNRITQGQFSFLPPLTDKQISEQLKYALKNGWAIGTPMIHIHAILIGKCSVTRCLT